MQSEKREIMDENCFCPLPWFHDWFLRGWDDLMDRNIESNSSSSSSSICVKIFIIFGWEILSEFCLRRWYPVIMFLSFKATRKLSALVVALALVCFGPFQEIREIFWSICI